jgi:O-antigen/teichoic acid export membrane protein
MYVLPSAIAGRERNDFSFLANLVGAALMLGLSAALVPGFGIVGAAAARALVQVFLLGATIWFATRWLGYELPYSHLLRLVVAALASALVAHLFVIGIPSLVGMIVGGVCAALTYVVLVRVLGAVPVTDVDRLRSILGRLPRHVHGPIMLVFAGLIRR